MSKRFIEVPNELKEAKTYVKVDNDFVPFEARTKRVQLVLQPSKLDRLKAIAKREGCSMNEIVHRLIDTYPDAEQTEYSKWKGLRLQKTITYECDECGGWTNKTYPYCPYCGKRMYIEIEGEKVLV